MPNVYETALGFRTALLQQERAAAAEMVRFYGAAYSRVQAQLSALLASVSAAKARGEYSPSWVHRERRLETLRAQILEEMRLFGAYAQGAVTRQMTEAAAAGQANALTMIEQSVEAEGVRLGMTFARVPTGAVQSLTGALQDGSPLAALLRGLGPSAADAAEKALAGGLATGLHPRTIARDLRKALGVGLDRALTISRTETLRAYREAARQTYQANADVVPQWRWLCAKSARTCAVCLAMDGQTFDTDTIMGTHPNCRCVMVPVVKSYAALGVSSVHEAARVPENGQGWFDRQGADVQRRILGPAKYDALKAGKIGLPDLVQYRDDPEWGPVRSEKSLSAALGT